MRPLHAPEVEAAHGAIHAPREDLMPPDLHRGDAVSEALHGLDRINGLAAAVPSAQGGVVAATDDALIRARRGFV